MEFVDGKWRWTEEEKQHKREQNKQLVWITDGLSNKRILKTDLIPEGWQVGRKIDWEFKCDVQSEEANKKRSEALRGRPSPNRGHISPKKGLTEVEYYGEEKALELAKSRSEVHRGQIPWNKDIPRTDEEKRNISAAKKDQPYPEGTTKVRVWNQGIRIAAGRTSVQSLEWKQVVKVADNFTCQHCGLQDKTVLQVHHIIPWEPFPASRFDPNNGLTLCANCHVRFEVILMKIARKGHTSIFIRENVTVCSKCHRLNQPSNIEGVTTCNCH
jgi:hypothetical protein